jgi:hypothetical protein
MAFDYGEFWLCSRLMTLEFYYTRSGPGIFISFLFFFFFFFFLQKLCLKSMKVVFEFEFERVHEKKNVGFQKRYKIR